MESLDGLASPVRTADIVDAMGRRHQHRCHLLDLVSPTPGRRLFGPAVTISYFPTCGAALARIAEAQREGWLGEVGGLQVSLSGAEDKLGQVERRCRTNH